MKLCRRHALGAARHLAVAAAPKGDRVALADENGRCWPCSTSNQACTATTSRRRPSAASGTTDEAHPGVARVYAQRRSTSPGEVTVFERPQPPFPELALDPAETRAAFAERGWQRSSASRPATRSTARTSTSEVRARDRRRPAAAPAGRRDQGGRHPGRRAHAVLQVLLDDYYPKDRVLLSVFPAAMRYAGPREAIFHAIMPQELRLHALHRRPRPRRRRQLLRHLRRAADLRRVRAGRAGHHAADVRAHLLVQRAAAGWPATKTCPHPAEDRVLLSGTKVREMLGRGERPPAEFSRPEVADILIKAYTTRRSMPRHRHLYDRGGPRPSPGAFPGAEAGQQTFPPVAEDPAQVASTSSRLARAPNSGRYGPRPLPACVRRGALAKRCSWCHSRNGPRRCSSTKRCGGSRTVISLRQRIGRPCSRSR